MENLKSYIESGILELYALHQLDDHERIEVEKMLMAHPSLKDELYAVEMSLEQYALQNSIEPSAHIRENLLSQIKFKEDNNFIPFEAGVAKINTHKERNLKFALVACVSLLIVSLVALLSTYQKLNNVSEQLAVSNSSKTDYAVRVSKMEFHNAGLENMLAMTQSKEWKTIPLQSVKADVNAKMLVYWNDNSQEVIINYAAMQLPNPDQNHEFQLWAIVKGQPVSLGVFASAENSKKAILNMSKIKDVEAFAVTVEPMGGQKTPTMEKMVVMGKLI